MHRLLLLSLLLLGVGSCAPQESWQAEMVDRLDSMVVLSESHEAVMQSVDSARVNAAYLEMGEHQVFFLAQVDEMMALANSQRGIYRALIPNGQLRKILRPCGG